MSVAVDRPSGARSLRATLAVPGGQTPHISARIDLLKRAQSWYDIDTSCVDSACNTNCVSIEHSFNRTAPFWGDLHKCPSCITIYARTAGNSFKEAYTLLTPKLYGGLRTSEASPVMEGSTIKNWREI